MDRRCSVHERIADCSRLRRSVQAHPAATTNCNGQLRRPTATADCNGFDAKAQRCKTEQPQNSNRGGRRIRLRRWVALKLRRRARLAPPIAGRPRWLLHFHNNRISKRRRRVPDGRSFAAVCSFASLRLCVNAVDDPASASEAANRAGSFKSPAVLRLFSFAPLRLCVRAVAVRPRCDRTGLAAPRE